MTKPAHIGWEGTAKRIARDYRAICGLQMPVRIGERTLKRKALPPFARPDAMLKGEVYQLVYRVGRAPRGDESIQRLVRLRDDNFVRRFPEATIVDWTCRLVNWSLVRSASGSKSGKRQPLLDKTALSHLRTELNFAYHCAIQPLSVVPFIYLVGGHEIISARRAHDGYPLFEEDWLGAMQTGAHPNYRSWRLAQDQFFGVREPAENSTATQSREPILDDDGWPE